MAAAAPTQTQFANPSLFAGMDPSISAPVMRDRGGRYAGGPVWSVGPVIEDRTGSSVTGSGALALTAAQVVGGYVIASQTSGSAANLTFPSSSTLLQALSGFTGGFVDLPNSDVSSNGPIRTFELLIHNTGTASNDLTLTAGSGTPTQTVVGSATIAAGTVARFIVKGQVSSSGTKSIAILRCV